MDTVYLALYKGKGNWVDRLVRFFTGKPYSHCEIAIQRSETVCECYSSSPRDGGVRCKVMRLPSDKWDLIPLPNANDQKIEAFFQKTAGKKYDFIGAVACVLPLPNFHQRYFCSEWCFEAIFGREPKRAISPNMLAEAVKFIRRYGFSPCRDLGF